MFEFDSHEIFNEFNEVLISVKSLIWRGGGGGGIFMWEIFTPFNYYVKRNTCVFIIWFDSNLPNRMSLFKNKQIKQFLYPNPKNPTIIKCRAINSLELSTATIYANR